jgi:hypothetical protein
VICGATILNLSRPGCELLKIGVEFSNDGRDLGHWLMAA